MKPYKSEIGLGADESQNMTFTGNQNEKHEQMFQHIEESSHYIKKGNTPAETELIHKYKFIQSQIVQKIKLKEKEDGNQNSEHLNAYYKSPASAFVERDVLIKLLKHDKYLLWKKLAEKNINTIEKILLNAKELHRNNL